MPEDPGAALIDLGNLSKPADTLIKKVSNAVGVLFEPRQIKRVAKAKAEAARIEAQSEIEITDLHRRAARRWIEEEAHRQENMEAVTAKAVPLLTKASKPDSVEDDWLVNFFDKSRIVSDDEMQGLWSRVLAGEAKHSWELLEANRKPPFGSREGRRHAVQEVLRICMGSRGSRSIGVRLQ